jgi:Reeler domain
MLRVLLAVFALFSFASVAAYPDFTGGCNAGTSVGDSHLTAKSKGALSVLKLQVRIGGKTLSPGKSFTVKAGTSVPISIVSTGGNTFRGFQFRISRGSTDTTTWLGVGTDENVQIDQWCQDLKVGGISHNNKKDKKSVAGTLKIPSAATGISLEVTIVVTNGHGNPSVWYKSNYKLVAK